MTQAPTEENLERARQRVMQLAREIEGLSREPIPANEFFPEFLDRVVAAVGAHAGAVWLLHEQSIALAAEVRLEEVGLNNPGVRQLNDRILADVLSTGEACTKSHDDGETQLPTDHMLVLCALHKEKKCVGVVQLFQRSDAPEEARAGYLQFLEQMSGYASRYIEGKGRKNQEAEAAPTGFWQDLEPFTLRLQQTLNSEEVSEIAASDGRLLLECDRLSIVTKKGAKIAVKAVSGQTSVNPRANLIRAMADLGQQVIAMGEPLMYSGRIDDLAPQIEKPLANFVQESTSRMVYLVPFFENLRVVRPDKEVESGKKSSPRRKAIGCLVVEQVAESEPGPALVQRTELLADHIGAAMDNARSQERIFGIGVWRRIGRTIEWFHGRRLAIAAAILAAVVAAFLCMLLIPAEYKVEAEGKLMPVDQIAVYAPEDGKVTDLYVEGSDRVDPDAVLMQLYSKVVEDEYNAAVEELANAEADYDKTQSDLEATDANPEARPQDVDRYAAELKNLESRIELLKGKLARKLDRRKNLTVRAPIGGLIPAINLKQKLDERPLTRGQHLFDIMDDSGKWRMEVQLPDKRMGNLLEAIRDNGGKPIEGEFSLATEPDKRYKCELLPTSVSTRTSVHAESGTVVELYVDPLELDERLKRIGAEVNVKLNCGKKSLGYKMFGDVIDTYHQWTWF